MGVGRAKSSWKSAQNRLAELHGSSQGRDAEPGAAGMVTLASVRSFLWPPLTPSVQKGPGTDKGGETREGRALPAPAQAVPGSSQLCQPLTWKKSHH